METFSYLSVLLSIIIGLSLTQLLQGIRGMALHRSRLRLYWPVLAWTATLLLMNVQAWWAMFGLRTHHRWTFLQFFVVLGHTVLLYLLSALLLPDIGARDDLDLRTHFYAHRRAFLAVLLGGVLASLAKDLTIDGELPEPANLGFHLAFIPLALVGMRTRHERYHETLAAGGLVAFTLYVLLLFSSLEGVG